MTSLALLKLTLSYGWNHWPSKLTMQLGIEFDIGPVTLPAAAYWRIWSSLELVVQLWIFHRAHKVGHGCGAAITVHKVSSSF